jgi:glutamine cyclotransferase
MGRKKKSQLRPIFFLAPLILLIPLALALFQRGPRDFSQYRYEVTRTFPHDPTAFTQGLLVHNGFLYESTGQYGSSSLRKTDMQTGEVLKKINLSSAYFGEGLAYRQGKLYQLTWREGKLFIYDVETFEKVGERTYTGEGWGLTYNGTHFIMSNGSSEITFRDPETFEVVRTIDVFQGSHRIINLNELEYIDGKIFANVYTSKDIVVINPENGRVEKRFVFRRFPRPDERTGREDVLNGIAHDPTTDLFYITGKYYSKMYELKMTADKDSR